MEEALIIRDLCEDDAEAIGVLTWEVFWKFIRPLYDQRGIFTFREFCRAEAIRYRFQRDHTFFGALVDDDLLVGVVEVNRINHLTMVFVEEGHQDRGVGRGLVEIATAYCRQRNPEIERITVNASPNSLGFYRHLGFVAAHDNENARNKNGILFVPMHLELP